MFFLVKKREILLVTGIIYERPSIRRFQNLNQIFQCKLTQLHRVTRCTLRGGLLKTLQMTFTMSLGANETTLELLV